MTVSEFIIKFLAERGVDTVFMVTGGQAMFLNDAVYKNKKVSAVFNHHEQAAGMAADAYSRISGKLGVAMVTAGPGAINVLNGVAGGFVDSAAMMVISGQSALATVSYMQRSKIRQHGLQGINIAPMAKPITKYFKTVDDPSMIQKYMEEAYFLATSGRRGPVWIEVPLDIQRMEIPTGKLEKFIPIVNKKMRTNLKTAVTKTLELLYKSKRPVFLAGQGIRLSGAQTEFLNFINKVKMPVITTRLGIDLIESESPFFVGRPGLYPDRAANFAVQNADLVISVGARLDIGIVGYDVYDWGRNAKKVVVDLDSEELNKPGIKIDLAVNCDAKEFLDEMSAHLKTGNVADLSNWVKKCINLRKKYPMVLPEYTSSKLVNSYYFSDKLSKYANFGDIIVVDTSSPFHVVCQTWQIKRGQRLVTTGGISTMGYWPSAIGACIASGKKRTIVVTGDGCLQMNIQELATVRANKLPIKIFVINNEGYLLIRHTQKTHMEGRLMGESAKTGLVCPDLMKIAKAYGILGVRIENTKQLDSKIKKVLQYPGPVLVDVKSPHWQLIIPRISSSRQKDGSMKSRPYEDLFPFLSPKDLGSAMKIKDEKA